jgi:nicotinamidase-related amidase
MTQGETIMATAPLTFNTGQTAILMADFHREGMGDNPMVQERGTVQKARAVLEAARQAGVLVVYIVVNFRQGYPEIADRNVIFRERKTSARVPPADPVNLIIPEVQPLPHEPVVVKHRVNAFFGTDLEMILRAHDIDTLVLLGHATSGVILSTVRYAADADYRLVVVEDGCADRDAEVHTVLMQRLFPRQATVVSAEAVIQALSRR